MAAAWSLSAPIKNSPAGTKTIGTPFESSISLGSTVGWDIVVGSGVFVVGMAVQVGSGVAVGGISDGVGDTSVGTSVAGREIFVGVLSGDSSGPHPLTNISMNKTMIKNRGFRLRLSMLLEIFSFFTFSRIVLDYGFWMIVNWIYLVIKRRYLIAELFFQDIFFLGC
jgi:hypothetical protein